MRIVVVGGGVSGLYASFHLAAEHDVTLVEAESRVGGHADTQRVTAPDGSTVNVDTGFIVFNRRHYPLFTRWIEGLGVEHRASDMSFSVSSAASGIEYNATDLDRLFCHRRNLLRPRFLRMVADILRFYRRAPGLLAALDDSTTLGDWLDRSSMGAGFAEDHLVPMAAALWSSPDREILDFPIRYLLEFMQNHDMLGVSGRPQWRTIRDGSRCYVEAALGVHRGRVITGRPVRRVERTGSPWRVRLEDGELEADAVVLACHADQALALLDDPGTERREVLGAFRCRDNDTVLHTDARLLPRHRRAWAAWNVNYDRARPGHAGISYLMNLLQGIPGETPYIVTLNRTADIDPARILARRNYRHPVYTPTSRAAQRRLPNVQGRDGLWFCGAWQGWGFHEDGVRSAHRVVEALTAPGVRRAA
ncbi:MAG: FAD-dependent oxidoreductase [Wenzhouxiangellaceae bacterium]|nr:FAD-dependent oxidoreductase [Wenzhouxiangellaceae bacterium]